MSLPDDADPAATAHRATEFFGPLVPGQLGCIVDHSVTRMTPAPE
jgi:hypothetical protein